MDEKVIHIVNEARWADGQRVWSRIEEITRDPMRSQEEFVLRLMRENATTDYGHAHSFEFVHKLDDFKRYIPLTTYENYIPYMDRIAHGERNVLTTYLTEHFSSLSGYRKLPQSRWGVQTSYDYSFCAGFYIVGHHGYLANGMTLNLVDTSAEHLPSGITVGNLLGRLLVRRDYDYKQVFAIPFDVEISRNRSDFLYFQALHAIKQENITLAICDHYSKMIDMLRYIEKHWPRLADDIEHGNPYFNSDPIRANAIREVMGTHKIGTQMLNLLWPELHCIMVFDVDCLSASFELLRTYCGDKVHFVFTGINLDEGTVTTGLHLDNPQTVLIPDSVFYEFKPKEDTDYSHLLTLDQLEVGNSYELIVTTLSGLYRYKTKKCFQVVGFFHDTPTVIIDKE